MSPASYLHRRMSDELLHYSTAKSDRAFAPRPARPNVKSRLQDLLDMCVKHRVSWSCELALPARSTSPAGVQLQVHNLNLTGRKPTSSCCSHRDLGSVKTAGWSCRADCCLPSRYLQSWTNVSGRVKIVENLRKGPEGRLIYIIYNL